MTASGMSVKSSLSWLSRRPPRMKCTGAEMWLAVCVPRLVMCSSRKPPSSCAGVRVSVNTSQVNCGSPGNSGTPSRSESVSGTRSAVRGSTWPYPAGIRRRPFAAGAGAADAGAAGRTATPAAASAAAITARRPGRRPGASSIDPPSSISCLQP